MAVIDSNYKEWTDALNIENIPNTLIDNYYHINLGTFVSSPQSDQHIVDSGAVTLTIFKRAFNNTSGARDTVLDAAHCIRIDLINPKNVETHKVSIDGNIEVVESSSISAIEIDESNDNIIKVEIEFNFRLFFCSI
jgi:hypothetical protein